MDALPPDAGDLAIMQPGAPGYAEALWQPVPANGHINVLIAPHRMQMAERFAMGTQTVPPGSFVREHAHDRIEEVIHVLSGHGTALIEDVEHAMVPGTTFFLGRHRRHKFTNTGSVDLTFMWIVVPNGLEEFFAGIGRPKVDGAPDPTPFPRPADVLQIEARTVFTPPTKNSQV
jgi:quercetin dioxygenase-like cupin family protein